MTSATASAAARLRAALLPIVRQLRMNAVDDRFTATQMSVLGTIQRHGPISVGELSDRERLSAPSISRVVTVLEQEGVVERLGDRTDRRICRVQLTSVGEKWVAETQSRRDEWLARRIDSLTHADRAALSTAIDVLEKIREGEE